MPVLANARHERFAQELAKGKTATEAYIIAGYKAHDGNAATLRGNQRVLERLAELQEKGAERALVTIESITRELDEDRELARKLEMPAAAISAVMGKAKLHGLLVDKSEVANTHHVISPDLPNQDEWEAEHVTPH